MGHPIQTFGTHHDYGWVSLMTPIGTTIVYKWDSHPYPMQSLGHIMINNGHPITLTWDNHLLYVGSPFRKTGVPHVYMGLPQFPHGVPTLIQCGTCMVHVHIPNDTLVLPNEVFGQPSTCLARSWYEHKCPKHSHGIPKHMCVPSSTYWDTHCQSLVHTNLSKCQITQNTGECMAHDSSGCHV